jgi:hypothetical protein
VRRHGVDALLDLIHKYETKNRALAWQFYELRLKLDDRETGQQS